MTPLCGGPQSDLPRGCSLENALKSGGCAER
jgi:hypothetical protein